MSTCYTDPLWGGSFETAGGAVLPLIYLLYVLLHNTFVLKEPYRTILDDHTTLWSLTVSSESYVLIWSTLNRSSKLLLTGFWRGKVINYAIIWELLTNLIIDEDYSTTSQAILSRGWPQVQCWWRRPCCFLVHGSKIFQNYSCKDKTPQVTKQNRS